MKMKLLNDAGHNTFLIEVEQGWFRPRLELYVGGGTVWRNWKTGQRASTLMERRLSDFLHFETRGVRT